MWIIGTFFSLIGGFIGTYFIKLWVKTGNPFLFLAVTVGVIVSWVGWIIALRSERLVIVEGFYGAVALILTLAMGFFLFHEKVSLQEGIGIILAILATILLIVKF